MIPTVEKIKIELPQIYCPFCGNSSQKITPEGNVYTYPDDDCCPSRTLWLLGGLTKNYQETIADGRTPDPGLPQDIARLKTILRRADQKDLDIAKRHCIEFNRSNHQYFNLDALIASVRRGV